MNQDVRLAVERQLGQAADDLARARLCFRGLSADALLTEHGHSGKSRQAVLESYEAEVQRWTVALESLGG